MRRVPWWEVAWLTAVWVLLWGDLSVGNVLAGAVIGVAVCAGLRMAPLQFHGRVRPLGLARLVGRFVVDLVRASFEVAAIALRPGYTPRGAVIGVRLRSQSDLYLTLTAELCSLVPGSRLESGPSSTRTSSTTWCARATTPRRASGGRWRPSCGARGKAAR